MNKVELIRARMLVRDVLNQGFELSPDVLAAQIILALSDAGYLEAEA